jgi:DTW domain-containing protein YfiP
MPLPFDLSTLKLSSFYPLDSSSARVSCPSCQRSRQWFCPDCVIPLVSDTPSVSLPVKLHIVRHAGELPAKSSVLPLRLILDDSQLQFYRYHCTLPLDLPATPPSQSVVVFPSSDSVDVASIDWTLIRHVTFIDSTWFQANEVNAAINPEIPRVCLPSCYRTFFWRPQHKGPECLATVEAVYLLLRDAFPGQISDDILWFYVYLRNIIISRSTSNNVANTTVTSSSI